MDKKQAAERLGVGLSMINRYITGGLLSGQKTKGGGPGKPPRYEIDESSVEALKNNPLMTHFDVNIPMIQGLKAEGLNQAQIARLIGCSEALISRKLKGTR